MKLITLKVCHIINRFDKLHWKYTNNLISLLFFMYLWCRQMLNSRCTSVQWFVVDRWSQTHYFLSDDFMHQTMQNHLFLKVWLFFRKKKITACSQLEMIAWMTENHFYHYSNYEWCHHQLFSRTCNQSVDYDFACNDEFKHDRTFDQNQVQTLTFHKSVASEWEWESWGLFFSAGPQNGWNDPPALSRAPKKKVSLIVHLQELVFYTNRDQVRMIQVPK